MATSAAKTMPRRNSGGVSIKAVLNGKTSVSKNNSNEKQESVEDKGIDPTWENPFNLDDLIQVWNRYAFMIKEENIRLYAILNNHKPELENGNVVRVGLKNKNQIDELAREKGNLFVYLKKELKNAKLMLETYMIKEDEGPKKAYTVSDKFKQMLDKNPALGDLKNFFDLDPD